MKRILLVLFCFIGFFSYGQKSYIPASPYPIEINQPDGTKIILKAKGDEKVHIAVTEDGYTVVKNKKGIYEYADLDENGDLIPSGYKARNLSERSSSEINFLTGKKKSIVPENDEIMEILKSAAIQKSFPKTGNRKTLLLLIDYPDLTSTYSSNSFNTLMNGASGSFHEYYIECSDNDLSVTVDVFGWYRASGPYLDYGDDEGDNAARELVTEAVDAAEAAGVDFSEYDNDGDGTVDNIMIVHSGPGAEEGRQTEYIWSHNWSLTGIYSRTYDGVTILNYSIHPETRTYTGGMVGIGVFCHEFGHALGLPDLYDTDYSSSGLGDWCLMSGGPWLNDEKTPAMMSAWCREKLGWINPTVIPYPITATYEKTYSLQPAATSTECYKIRTQNSNEYFLLENTYKTGYNAYLPGSGLAIYHINTSRLDHGDNDDETRKLVDLEEADGLEELDSGSDDGDSGDVFPGSTHNTEFTDNTDPNARTYTSEDTDIEVLDINLSGSTVSFTINNANQPTPNLTYNPSENGFAVNGTNIEIGLQVRNQGDANAGSFTIGYYLSLNTSITTGDYLIGTDFKSSLNAGSSVYADLAIDVSTIPGIPNGNYYLGYIIDYLGTVAESNENDNSYINTGLQVTLNILPNLTYIGGENNLEINGNLINVELVVNNDGDKASDACRVGYYLSSDAVITTSDYRIGTDFVGILNSGQSSVESETIDASFFPGLDAGSYYFGYIVDYQDAVDEEDEGDNTYVFGTPRFNYCPGSREVFNETICEGESILFQGNIYDTQGEYEFTYTNTDGCDSVIVLNLTVLENEYTFLNETICEGDSFQLGGRFYAETGVYNEVFVNRHGCDSTVILDLEVRETQVLHEYAQICEGNEIQVGSFVLNEGGIYNLVFSDQFGCDSIVVFHLTVFPENNIFVSESICPGESYEFGGEIYNSEGIYTHTFQNQYGCDSVVVLDLRINDTKEVFLTENICRGDSIVVGGEAFYNTGIYEMTLTSKWGCDSVIHLDLAVNPTNESEITESICEGEVFYVGNEEFDQTGIYEVVLENQY
ncbi:MAG: M6 family metalloprotease domain-containing protein, partial [Prolixibacteraceae bacterium]|nr:M6 family metalloprotease domain-containing protein [Prolixibacteraceae bacterium]